MVCFIKANYPEIATALNENDWWWQAGEVLIKALKQRCALEASAQLEYVRGKIDFSKDTGYGYFKGLDGDNNYRVDYGIDRERFYLYQWRKLNAEQFEAECNADEAAWKAQWPSSVTQVASSNQS